MKTAAKDLTNRGDQLASAERRGQIGTKSVDFFQVK
jgi:hypothetical protein